MTATSDNATDITLGYYAEHAQDFVSSTVDVEFASMYRPFEELLAAGARVLDFGCGSGRDAKHFSDAGYCVTAVDGSPELCAAASELTGLPVRQMLFQDLDEVDAYDGIWACSSILHLPKAELLDVLNRMAAAVVDGGVVYTSFKYGDFEGLRHGRYFTNFTEESFAEFVAQVPLLALERVWVTGDVRPGRGDERWLNLILRKAGDACATQ